LERFGFLERFGVDFTQLVGFVEIGHVAPEFDPRELHEDMKLSYGVGLRASAQGLMVRADLSFSEEGGQLQMFVSQPFWVDGVAEKVGFEATKGLTLRRLARLGRRRGDRSERSCRTIDERSTANDRERSGPNDRDRRHDSERSGQAA